jgi:Zn-dependent protease with chaperone function
VFSIAVGVLVTEGIRFRADDDPLARLALVVAFAGIAGLLAFPVYNVYARHIEEKADAYALSITHDPASAIRSYVRSADRRFAMLCAPRAAILYFAPAPALGSRIASAAGRPDPCR